MKDAGQVRPILQAGLRSLLHSSLILLGLLFAAGASRRGHIPGSAGRQRR